MRKTRDSVGTGAPSGQSTLEGSRASRSKRFVTRLRNYIGQDLSPGGDAGAAMVEMAFIFSILVMLLVGVVTSAIAFGQKNSIENAAREASRYAATLAPDPAIDTAWLEQVRNVAREAAQGNLDASVDGYYICVAHTNSNLKLVDTGGVQNVSSGDCYTETLSDSRVQVETRRNTEINAAFFSVDVTLNAPATARYEREE